MKQNYFNYDVDDILVRNFMIPAVMPNNTSNDYMNMQKGKFMNPEEGFLRGNMEAGAYIPYKNMTYLKPNVNNEKDRLLYNIQKYSFAAHDLNLYLDTHPNDSNTINLYNKYNTESKRLVNEFERKYGPIDLSDDEGLKMSPWAWMKEPWPWNM